MNNIDSDCLGNIFSYLTPQERESFALTNKSIAASYTDNLKEIHKFIENASTSAVMAKIDHTTMQKIRASSTPTAIQKTLIALQQIYPYADPMENDAACLLSDFKTQIDKISRSHERREIEIYTAFFSLSKLPISCEKITQAKKELNSFQKNYPATAALSVREAINKKIAIPIELIKLSQLTVKDLRLILPIAITHNQIDVVKAILEDNRIRTLPWAESWDIIPDSIFVQAAKEGKNQIIQFICNTKSIWDKLTWRKIIEPFLIAGKNGHATCFKSIVDILEKKELLNYVFGNCTKEISTLLIEAASKGYTEIVRVIWNNKELRSFLSLKTTCDALVAAHKNSHENCRSLILEKLELKNIDKLIKFIQQIDNQEKVQIFDIFIQKNPKYLAVAIQATAAYGRKELLGNLLDLLKTKTLEIKPTIIPRQKISETICTLGSQIDFWPSFWINLCCVVPFVLGFLLFALGGWICAVQQRSLSSLYSLCFWIRVQKDKYTLFLDEAIAIARENGHTDCVKKLEEFLDIHHLRK